MLQSKRFILKKDNVRVRIPDVNRYCMNSQNILPVIPENIDNLFYVSLKIGTFNQLKINFLFAKKKLLQIDVFYTIIILAFY